MTTSGKVAPIPNKEVASKYVRVYPSTDLILEKLQQKTGKTRARLISEKFKK